MARLLVCYAHPGHKHSHVNKYMASAAAALDGITFVDLYSDYPRFDIDVDAEQQRLLDHDVILFQFPLFWYSTPSIVKEWQDLVLEHGFAYGTDGDKLAGKRMMLVVSGAGPKDAYTHAGYQHFPIRTFLTPLEQTARRRQCRRRQTLFQADAELPDQSYDRGRRAACRQVVLPEGIAIVGTAGGQHGEHQRRNNGHLNRHSAGFEIGLIRVPASRWRAMLRHRLYCDHHNLATLRRKPDTALPHPKAATKLCPQKAAEPSTHHHLLGRLLSKLS